MKTIALLNLGCSKNQVDGESIAGFLQASGYQFVEAMDAADVIVVNTCAFIQEAKEEAIDSIIEAARYKTEGRCRTLIVAGCFSQRYREEVAAQFPEVDLWTGVDDWATRLTQHLALQSAAPAFNRTLTTGVASQYLKIAEGCSHRCAFCAIPAIRGPFVSRAVDEVVAEAQWLEARGAVECILVSQDTSAWGSDTGSSLVKLVEAVLAKTSFPWIRLMYLHPNRIDDELLRLVAAEPRLCPYFDIPLQHIAEPMLTGMRRRASSAELYRCVERIRTLCPEAAIRTTFILGFPGETDAHVQQLLEFIEWARFEKMGVFPFSPEEGTAAYDMRPRPRHDTARQRCETVMTVQREISREIGEARIGTTVPVILDGPSDDPAYAWEGRTRWDAPEVDGRVFVPAGNYRKGEIIPVKITGAKDYDLFG
jgi:ribosomal protein S12 methylthiotransferase